MLTALGVTRATGVVAQQADEAKARAAILEILKAHTEHWNRHDMTAWADAIPREDSDWVNWRGGYWRGKAAIRVGHEEVHRSYYRSSRISPQRVEDLAFPAPDTAPRARPQRDDGRRVRAKASNEQERP